MIKEFAVRSEMMNVLMVINIKFAFLMNMLICGEAEHAFGRNLNRPKILNFYHTECSDKK